MNRLKNESRTETQFMVLVNFASYNALLFAVLKASLHSLIRPSLTYTEENLPHNMYYNQGYAIEPLSTGDEET